MEWISGYYLIIRFHQRRESHSNRPTISPRLGHQLFLRSILFVAHFSQVPWTHQHWYQLIFTWRWNDDDCHPPTVAKPLISYLLFEDQTKHLIVLLSISKRSYFLPNFRSSLALIANKVLERPFVHIPQRTLILSPQLSYWNWPTTNISINNNNKSINSVRILYIVTWQLTTNTLDLDNSKCPSESSLLRQRRKQHSPFTIVPTCSLPGKHRLLSTNIQIDCCLLHCKPLTPAIWSPNQI